MVEPITYILGGIVIAFVSGTTGKYLGSNGRVKDITCVERQHACSTIVVTKIDGLTKTVDELRKAVNNKLLGV